MSHGQDEYDSDINRKTNQKLDVKNLSAWRC